MRKSNQIVANFSIQFSHEIDLHVKAFMSSLKSIEDIILQHSTRGMDKIQKHYPHEHTKNAVEAFLKLPKGVVFIYTGFYVAGFAETDGPLGA